MEDQEYQIKIILLGDSGVGKSSIVLRYVSQYFREDQECTLGAIFMTKTVEFGNKKFKFQIWDTAGQEKYRALVKSYYQDVTAALFVYDITSIDSFNDLQNWYNDLSQASDAANVIKMVVGNKIDLEHAEEVSIQNVLQYASTINASYFRTSAKLANGIDQAFYEISRQVSEKIDKESQNVETSSIKIKPHRAIEPALKKKMCC